MFDIALFHFFTIHDAILYPMVNFLIWKFKVDATRFNNHSNNINHNNNNDDNKKRKEDESQFQDDKELGNKRIKK